MYKLKLKSFGELIVLIKINSGKTGMFVLSNHVMAFSAELLVSFTEFPYTVLFIHTSSYVLFSVGNIQIFQYCRFSM